MTFDDCFSALLLHEGGYVNHPSDPGKETKFGISKRAYPMEDIPNMTVERAKFLYHRDYWGPAGCDTLPEPLRFHVFDFAVNSGVKTAIKQLQTAVGEFPDGIIGPKTLGAIASYPIGRLIVTFSAHRLTFLAGLPSWPAFGRGWVNRVAANLLLSAKDIK